MIYPSYGYLHAVLAGKDAAWRYYAPTLYVDGRPRPASAPTSLPFQLQPDLARLPRSIARGIEEQFFDGYARTYDDSLPAPPGCCRYPGDPYDWQHRYWVQEALGASVKGFIDAHIDRAFSWESINDQAMQSAEWCRRIDDLDGCIDYCWGLSINPPVETKRSTRVSRLRRLISVRWWRRAIKKNWTRLAENKLRQLNLVQRRKQLYCSDLTVQWHAECQRKNEAYLKAHVVASSAGEQLDLWDVSQKSLSNKALRRAELMTRIKGIESWANKNTGYVADLVTLTVPSCFHATHADGSANARYRGYSVREASQWLSAMFARVRATLARQAVPIFGLRVSEPHHDGTPHWHLVLFCNQDYRDTVRQVFARYWLSEGGDDPGAADHRITFLAVDAAKGSAAGYVAKYVAKNIDGFLVGEDLEALGEELPTEKTKSLESVRRVAAWASVHGIRQFQFFGTPPIGPYREARRLREPITHTTIEPMRAAADQGDFGLFLERQGGVHAGRDTKVRLWSEITGEINGYDELRGKRIVGLLSVSEAIETRQKTWVIERKDSYLKSSLGLVSITVRRDFAVEPNVPRGTSLLEAPETNIMFSQQLRATSRSRDGPH